MLEIKHASAYLVNIPTSRKVFPFRVSYGTIPGLKRVFLKVMAKDADNEFVGWGEAAPIHPYSNESAFAVYELLEGAYAKKLVGKKIGTDSPEHAKSDISIILDNLEGLLGAQRLPFTQCAIDYALFDLIGKACNTPIYKILNPAGPTRKFAKPCWSIGFSSDLAAVRSETEKFLRAGYAIKIKLSGDLQNDLLLTEHVINTALSFEKNGTEIRADANSGFAPSDAHKYCKSLPQKYGAEVLRKLKFFVEEPTDAKKFPDSLISIASSSEFPIMLDESLYTKTDAKKYIALLNSGQLPRNSLIFNIKVQKVGGLKAAMELAGLASKAGIGVMIGGMFESSFGKQANCHYAMSIDNLLASDGVHPSKDYVNIDEPVIMERLEDVEKITDDGRDLSYFQDRPGFGVTINEAMLRSNTIFKLEDVKNYQPDIIQHG